MGREVGTDEFPGIDVVAIFNNDPDDLDQAIRVQAKQGEDDCEGVRKEREEGRGEGDMG